MNIVSPADDDNLPELSPDSDNDNDNEDGGLHAEFHTGWN
jgi:hypothetical protein